MLSLGWESKVNILTTFIDSEGEAFQEKFLYHGKRESNVESVAEQAEETNLNQCKSRYTDRVKASESASC